MSETIDIEKARSPNPAWLAIPLVLVALLSVTVGLIARGTIRQPYPTPFFRLFFSDALHMKAWLITAAVVLGFFQLLTAARIYQLLRFPPPGRLYNLVHRFAGYTAVALTVPVAYHCVFLLGFGTYDLRVYIHSILGSIVYGMFIAKVLLVGWALPIAGGLLFATLLGLWQTSALWFFSTFGVGI